MLGDLSSVNTRSLYFPDQGVTVISSLGPGWVSKTLFTSQFPTTFYEEEVSDLTGRVWRRYDRVFSSGSLCRRMYLYGR